MSVVSVNEHKTPTFSSTADEDTATRYFIVKLTSSSYGPRTALQAVMNAYGIRVGTWYAYGSEVAPGCRAKTIGPATAIDGSKTLYAIQVQYSSTQPDEEETPEDPLDLATQWGPAGTRTIQKTVYKDKNGRPFVNSVGDPLNDGVSVGQNVSWIKARKNVISTDFDRLAKFTNAWNSNAYLGQPKRTVKISSMEYSERKWKGDASYFEFSAEFEFYDEEQFIELPNLGWRANFMNDVGDIGGGQEVGDIELMNVNEGASAATSSGSMSSENIGNPISSPALLKVDTGFLASRDALMLDEAPQHENTILKFDVKRTEAFEELEF